MKKQEFKEKFIIIFLATWSANNYESGCYNGIFKNPPVEDAECLADQAWGEYLAKGSYGETI
jgi:hypothetical protein